LSDRGCWYDVVDNIKESDFAKLVVNGKYNPSNYLRALLRNIRKHYNFRIVDEFFKWRSEYIHKTAIKFNNSLIIKLSGYRSRIIIVETFGKYIGSVNLDSDERCSTFSISNLKDDLKFIVNLHIDSVRDNHLFMDSRCEEFPNVDLDSFSDLLIVKKFIELQEKLSIIYYHFSIDTFRGNNFSGPLIFQANQ